MMILGRPGLPLTDGRSGWAGRRQLRALGAGHGGALLCCFTLFDAAFMLFHAVFLLF